ncbi:MULTISPECIES: YnfA family protein [Leisingera]|uniref:YnfA family protein n=2 Tax=Leisingera TaxID=191028 RepID=A0ABY5WRB6_9RHOB|nr:YnfA family protein [Leisingera aquaemixtae]UWQ53148.1 YnfA family protein [Leisingera caerulea]
MFRRGCPGVPGAGGAGILTGTFLIFALAALAEIAGCFAFWAWLRLDRSPLWLVPGIASLVLFAYLLTRADSAFAGRAYAAYGGVYIASSMFWMWLAEGNRPDRWDIAGMMICLIGSALILMPLRS